MKRENWIKLLKKREAFCYIKATSEDHDSGYKCFEVGYCTTKGSEMKEKLKLGEYTDHIILYDMLREERLNINMDLLEGGYVRVWDSSRSLWWGSVDFVVSSASLRLME